MAEFYDNPTTGKLHFRAEAGGVGGGQTGMFDAPATRDDIVRHPIEYAAYGRAKAAEATKADENAARASAIDDAKETISELQAEKSALETQVEHLSDAVGKL